MNNLWAMITWARDGIWQQTAIYLKKDHDFELNLVWWKDIDWLIASWISIWASFVITWDLFTPNVAYTEALNSKSRVQVLNAAINIDNVEDKDEQVRLAEVQNSFLEEKLLELEYNNIDNPILLVVITSVTSSFVDILWEKALKRSAYALMKNKHSEMLRGYSPILVASWVSVVDVQPWLVQTEMVKHLGENWLKLANILWKKADKKKESDDETIYTQERALTPQEVWKAISDMISYRINRNEICPYEKYPIINQADLDMYSK